MNSYSSIGAAIKGALPLTVFVAPPPVEFGPIFNPPSRPALAAVSGGAGAGLVGLTIGASQILCNT